MKSSNPLHPVQSFRLDQHVRRCANILKDSSLHAKLQKADLIAQDAMYHCVCLSKLYKTASSLQLDEHIKDRERKFHVIAFSEVALFILKIVMNATETILASKLSTRSNFMMLT